jgi:hypothetical protein
MIDSVMIHTSDQRMWSCDEIEREIGETSPTASTGSMAPV